MFQLSCWQYNGIALAPISISKFVPIVALYRETGSKPYRASSNDQGIIGILDRGSRATLEPLGGRRREPPGSRFPDGSPREAL